MSPLQSLGHAKRSGRNGDTELLHVSRGELRALSQMSPDGRLSRNPKTGLPEAFSLKDILPAVASAAAPVLFPGIGEAASSFLGIDPTLGASLTGGLMGGGVSALLGGNPLVGAGLGAVSPLALAGLSDLFPETMSGIFGTGTPQTLGQAYGQNSSLTQALSGLGANESAPAQAAGGAGSWAGRNWPWLAAAGALAAGSNSSQPQQATTQATATNPQNNTPLPEYSFERRAQAPSNDPQFWYRIGRTPGAIQFFDKPEGEYVEQRAKGGPLRAMTGGGQEDNIPARLSRGEYVMDATTVADVGDGNTEEGFKRLDEMRERIARDKGRKSVVPGKAKHPLQYLGA